MLRRTLPILAVVVYATACASPTLPLPPPEAPTIARGADADHVTLEAVCGSAVQGATVISENTNSAVPPDEAVTGTIASDCGSWTIPNVYAHNGDVLYVTQQYAGTISTPQTVQVSVP